MVITPLEIEGHEFKKKFGGVDPREVRAFLNLVAEEFEKLVVANGKLQDEVTDLRERLGELRERERLLKETMVTAQRLSQEMKEESHRARELIVKEGELKADQVVSRAQERANELDGAIIDLKLERDAFESRLKHMLEQHLRLIELRRQDEDVASRVTYIRQKASGADGPDPSATG